MGHELPEDVLARIIVLLIVILNLGHKLLKLSSSHETFDGSARTTCAWGGSGRKNGQTTADWSKKRCFWELLGPLDRMLGLFRRPAPRPKT